MKIYEAIERVGQAAIQDGLCDAIILKGSIGRGDEDQYSDVDMYLITSKENYENVLEKRESYLEAYKEIIFREENDFGVLQMLAIFEDGVHFDLYTTTVEQMEHGDPIKVYYDPKGLFADYSWKRPALTTKQKAKLFDSALYYFVEGNSAYCRKNYPWAANIMGEAINCSVILIRSYYDGTYAFLGLKKINEILPQEEYAIVERAYGWMNQERFPQAVMELMKLLDLYVVRCGEDVKKELNLKFYGWVKENLGKTLFVTMQSE